MDNPDRAIKRLVYFAFSGMSISIAVFLIIIVVNGFRIAIVHDRSMIHLFAALPMMVFAVIGFGAGPFVAWPFFKKDMLK